MSAEKKEGVFGLANDFSKENFEIIDTQYSIEDFKMLDLDSRANVDIALVLDSSGSMEGLPLRDLKVAALSCVDKLDIWNSKMAVVEYNSDARLVVSSTNSKINWSMGLTVLFQVEERIYQVVYDPVLMSLVQAPHRNQLY